MMSDHLPCSALLLKNSEPKLPFPTAVPIKLNRPAAALSTPPGASQCWLLDTQVGPASAKHVHTRSRSKPGMVPLSPMSMLRTATKKLLAIGGSLAVGGSG